MSDLKLTNDNRLYPREVTLKGQTVHSRYCQRTPRRYDWNCERCIELMRGAAPRHGWQHEYFARKFNQVQRHFTWG